VTTSALERLKAAKAASSRGALAKNDVSGDVSDDDDQLDLAVVEREERLEAAVSRVCNPVPCVKTGFMC